MNEDLEKKINQFIKAVKKETENKKIKWKSSSLDKFSTVIRSKFNGHPIEIFCIDYAVQEDGKNKNLVHRKFFKFRLKDEKGNEIFSFDDQKISPEIWNFASAPSHPWSDEDSVTKKLDDLLSS